MFNKDAKNVRQDDSLPYIQRLILQGYDFCIFNIHENFDITKCDGSCEALNGEVIDLKWLISDLKHTAPIFELTHVNCLCHLLCYSSTNDNLQWIIVDWKGMSETGRYTDRSDKRKRREDYERLYNEYRNKFDELENNKFLTGSESNPEVGIYSFDCTLYDTNYTVNQVQQLKDKILEIILDKATIYGINIEDANLIGNDYVISTDKLLSIYDFSKEEMMEVNWYLKDRGTDLQGVIDDLAKLEDFLIFTQNSINEKLLSFETTMKVSKLEPTDEKILKKLSELK